MSTIDLVVPGHPVPGKVARTLQILSKISWTGARLGPAEARIGGHTARSPTATSAFAGVASVTGVVGVENGRFGDRKVFIAAVWTQMVAIEARIGGTLTAGATLEQFKAWLMRSRLYTSDGAEHGARLVVLCRSAGEIVTRWLALNSIDASLE